MAGGVRFEFSGQAVQNLLGDPAVRSLVEAKTAEVRANLEANAPVDDGDYKASISSDVVQGATRPVGRVKVGAPHWALVEFGTVERAQKNGRRTGRMPPLSPLRKAISSAGLRLK